MSGERSFRIWMKEPFSLVLAAEVVYYRLVTIDNGSVKFKYKDYQDGKRIKEMTLTAYHFIQRFLWHIVSEH